MEVSLKDCKHKNKKGRFSFHDDTNPTDRTESLTKLIYRKMSNLSVNAHISTLPLPLNCKFKMITRTWSPEVTVAFMIVGMPGYLLSSGKSELSSGKSDDMIAEKMSSERKFWDRCSFFPSINLWFDGFCAFESTREASRYILYDGRSFTFRKYDGTMDFKEQASFVFRKKKKKEDRQRAKSAVTNPKKFLELDMLDNIDQCVRKFSLSTYQDKKKLVDWTPDDAIMDATMETTNNCLFSLYYNTCLETIDLRLYGADLYSNNGTNNGKIGKIGDNGKMIIDENEGDNEDDDENEDDDKNVDEEKGNLNDLEDGSVDDSKTHLLKN